MAQTQKAKSLACKAAAHVMHATCDEDMRRAKIRDARWSRLEHEVDPTGKYSTAERRRRAESLMRAQMTQLANRRHAKTATTQPEPEYKPLKKQCAWCEAERHGGDKAKVPAGRTDGICKRHLAQLIEEAQRRGIIIATHGHEPLPAA